MSDFDKLLQNDLRRMTHSMLDWSKELGHNPSTEEINDKLLEYARNSDLRKNNKIDLIGYFTPKASTPTQEELAHMQFLAEVHSMMSLAQAVPTMVTEKSREQLENISVYAYATVLKNALAQFSRYVLLREAEQAQTKH